MDNRINLVTIAVAVGVAGFVAVTLGWVAHYDLGFSRAEIRSEAILAAILIAVLLAIEFFGKKLGKPE